MTREDAKKLFPDATDEQLDALMNLHGASVERTKAQTAEKLKAAQDELKAAKATITQLEADKGDTDKLQAEIDRYKQQEAQREKDAQTAQARQALEKRFEAVVGERKFVHDFVKQGVLSAFEAAVADDGNTGKGDKEIFDTITKDKDYFASMNPPAPTSMGTIGATVTDDAAVRAVMGLPPAK